MRPLFEIVCERQQLDIYSHLTNVFIVFTYCSFPVFQKVTENKYLDQILEALKD